MFKRLLWLGIGIGVGVVVVRKLTRTAEAFTPTGIAGSIGHSAGDVMSSVRSFVADVRTAASEREAEINAAFTDGFLLPEHATEGDQY